MPTSVAPSFLDTVSIGNSNSVIQINTDGTTCTTVDQADTTITSYNLDATKVTQSVNGKVTTIINDENASINDVALDIPEYPFGDEYFETVVLNSYIDNLLSTATVTNLSNLDTYKYYGDFYGILNELNIPLKYHPIIMRMNGITDTGLYNPNITSILIPDFTAVDSIGAVYQNTVPNPLS